jgi:DNA-binding transcriptional regulator YiaG
LTLIERDTYLVRITNQLGKKLARNTERKSTMFKTQDGSGANPSTRSNLNGLGPFDRAGDLPVNLPMEFVVAASTKFTQKLGNVGNFAGEVHEAKVNPPQGESRGKSKKRPKWLKLPVFIEETKNFRERTGTSQTEVAKMLGVTLATIRNWLYGSKIPGFHSIQRAARLYGISVLKLLDEEVDRRK